MRLTGEQIKEIADFSDGADVTVNHGKLDDGDVRVTRIEDGVEITFDVFGVEVSDD